MEVEGVERAVAYDDLRAWIKALDKAGELKTHPRTGGPRSRDRRDHRSGFKVRENEGGVRWRPCASVRRDQGGIRGGRVLINQFGSEARMKNGAGGG